MPADQIVQQSFKDWRGGPWHSLGPDKGPAMGRRYDSINLQVYENGTLGVRPCLVTKSGADFTETLSAFLGAAYFHKGYSYSYDTFSDKYMYIFDGSTTVRVIDLQNETNGTETVSTAASINRQTIPGRYSTTHQLSISRLPYVEVGTDDAYYSAEAVITNFDGTPGVTSITQPSSWDPHTTLKHRDKYWSWGDVSNANRIHYSIPGDYTDWTGGLAGNIDIGADPNLPIVGVWPIYDSLMIAMKDLRWYVFRFTDDPQFGEIRYVGTKRIPDFSVQVAEPGDSLLYLTENGGIVVITPEAIDDITLDYISVPTGKPLVVDHYFYRGLVAPEHNAVCLPFGINSIPANSETSIHKGDLSFDLVNGVWTKSLYWGVASAGDQVPAIVDAFQAGTSHFGFLAVPDGVGGSTWSAYVRPVTLNRPSNDSDPDSSSQEAPAHSSVELDRFTAELTLARWRPPEADTGILEAVIIDFDYWHATGFKTPAFVVTVDYEHGGTETLGAAVGTLDATTLDATLTYTSERTRVVFNPAALPAMSSALIHITGIRSVAFVDITVEFRVQSQEPLTSQGAT